MTLFAPSILAELLDSSPSMRSRIADAFVPNAWTIVVLGGGIAFMALVVVPRRQRNEARRVADDLSRDIADRERIDFRLTADSEEWPNTPWDFNDVGVSDITWLWVDVANDGPPAEFTASVLDVRPVERFVDGVTRPTVDVNRVAWEHHLVKGQLIARNENERLRLAWYSADPGVLTFWMPESASWGLGSHNSGWRLRCLDDIVTFELVVRNTTSDKTVTRSMELRFGSDGRLERFGFVTGEDVVASE